MTRVGELLRAVTDTVRDPFSTDPTGLPSAGVTEEIVLRDGDTFEMVAAPVHKRLGQADARMLAYNGSIPGPTLRVAQGSQIDVSFSNRAEVPTTVHWHGLRLDNPFDGVPSGMHRGMQAPIETGGSFTYRLRFPDPGIYWYHPHIREDYTQELGLYGTIIVTPTDPAYWAPVNREMPLVLDDILVKGDKIAPFSRRGPNRTAMGRYGNIMLINGETDYRLDARPGEVVRLYLTNTANVRPFRFTIPGARMKLVGGDGGRIERERFVDDVVIAPSERAVVEVLFADAGELPLEHRGPDVTRRLGTVRVAGETIEPSFVAEFETLRTNGEFEAERASLPLELERAPDKSLSLVAVMPGMKQHGGGHGSHVDIEWEDTMQLHNRMTTPWNMFWKLVDPESGAQNEEIRWAFRVGDRIKVRITNERHSDHPMQHPFHIHGERFLVIARDGAPNENLVWKDTVLIPTGESVDLLVDMSNPGTWMAHCHIAEHLEGGMMLSFQVGE